MQIAFSTNTPLAAGGQFVSAWFQADPNWPFVMLEAASDVAGSLQLYESDNVPGGQGDGSADIIAGLAVLGGTTPAATSQPIPTGQVMLQAMVRGIYWRVVYTNGPAAQTVFGLTLQSSTIPIDTSANRKLDLILRELRVQSLIGLYLKEPTGSIGPNVPYGLGDLTQGTVFPGAPAIAALPPIPTVPTFD